MKRIAVLTSGGDAPGMNAAIRAVVRCAAERGVETLGVRCGYAGLVADDMAPLTPRDVGGIIELGGTVLETARCPEFQQPEVRARAAENLARRGAGGLVVIGGNGSQAGALALAEEGTAVIGVASTIDNDLSGTDLTIGVDTALNVALESIDRIRTTARSMRRVFIVEVMGRECGYLALAAGLAGGAEVIVAPECDLEPADVAARLESAGERGKRRAIVVVAEGARNNAHRLFEHFRAHHGALLDPRLTVLGHVQRGGRPTAFDRLLATRLAARAVELLLDGTRSHLVGLCQGVASATPLKEVVGRPKVLPPELLALAETLAL